MTGRGAPTAPGIDTGAVVGIGGGIGGGIGLVAATAISAEFPLWVVFGACVGVLIGLMLEVVLAAKASRSGQG